LLRLEVTAGYQTGAKLCGKPDQRATGDELHQLRAVLRPFSRNASQVDNTAQVIALAESTHSNRTEIDLMDFTNYGAHGATGTAISPAKSMLFGGHLSSSNLSRRKNVSKKCLETSRNGHNDYSSCTRVS